MVIPGSGAPAGALSVAYQEADLGRVRDGPRRRAGATRSTPRSSPHLPAAIAPSPRFSTACPMCSPRATCAPSSPAWRAAARARRGVVLLLGGHVIKVGLGPLVAAWLAPRHRHPRRPQRRGRDPRLRAGGVRRDQRGRGERAGRRQLRHGGGDRGRDERRHRGGGGRRSQGWAKGWPGRSRNERSCPGARCSVLLAALERRRAGDGARRDRRGDHPPAPLGGRRGARRDQPPRLPAAGRVTARCSTAGARCSTWGARWCCRRCSSRR